MRNKYLFCSMLAASLLVSSFGTSANAAITAPNLNVTCVNNVAGTVDVITVSNLSIGDTIKVYKERTDSTPILSGTATSATLTLQIAQLGTASGRLYFTLTPASGSESVKAEKTYPAEVTAKGVGVQNITITNNVGIADTVVVTQLLPGDLISVYRGSADTTALATGTVASGATSVNIPIGNLGAAAGTVYIKLSRNNQSDSVRTAKSYSPENKSKNVTRKELVVTNNCTGVSDTVSVTNVVSGSVIRVYPAATGSTTLVSGTVAAGQTSITLSISQLGIASGTVYVSIQEPGKNEGSRVARKYLVELKTPSAMKNNVIILNNVGAADTVKVKNLRAGDVVRVYFTSSGGTVLGSATVGSGAQEATVSIPQLGTGATKIYIGVVRSGFNESTRLMLQVPAELLTVAPTLNNIDVLNNRTGTADTITVTKVQAGDVVKIYSTKTSTTPIASGTVGASQASITLSVAQLGVSGGTIYVTLTRSPRAESVRIPKAVLSET